MEATTKKRNETRKAVAELIDAASQAVVAGERIKRAQKALEKVALKQEAEPCRK